MDHHSSSTTELSAKNNSKHQQSFVLSGNTNPVPSPCWFLVHVIDAEDFAVNVTYSVARRV